MCVSVVKCAQECTRGLQNVPKAPWNIAESPRNVDQAPMSMPKCPMSVAVSHKGVSHGQRRVPKGPMSSLYTSALTSYSKWVQIYHLFI